MHVRFADLRVRTTARSWTGFAKSIVDHCEPFNRLLVGKAIHVSCDKKLPFDFFWLSLLCLKFWFSYTFQIEPLIQPTLDLWEARFRPPRWQRASRPLLSLPPPSVGVTPPSCVTRRLACNVRSTSRVYVYRAFEMELCMPSCICSPPRFSQAPSPLALLRLGRFHLVVTQRRFGQAAAHPRPHCALDASDPNVFD